MKIQYTYVLTSEKGNMLPWGLAGFESFEDAAGFLDFIRAELASGVVDYLREARRQARKAANQAGGQAGHHATRAGTTGGRKRQKSFRADLEFAMQRLVKVGRLSCEEKYGAGSARASTKRRQQELELEQAQQRERQSSGLFRQVEVALQRQRQIEHSQDRGPELGLDRGLSR